MDASEIQPLMQFLRQLVPFDTLPEAALTSCVRSLNVIYYSKTVGHVPLLADDPKLYIVRSGAFEVRNVDNELLDRLGEGGFFGFPSLMSGEAISNKVLILEDGLVYQLDADTFNRLRQASREFDRFFNRAFARRMRHQAQSRDKELLTTCRVNSLMVPSPLTINCYDSIHNAARMMRDARVSSLLITDNNKLCGILTDRDMRNRVLAEGMDGNLPVHQAMTINPVTVPPTAMLFDAMLAMSAHNIHHLPVLDGDEPVGVISSTDILRSQGSQPILLIGEIERQTNIGGLIAVSHKIPIMLQRLIGADARAEEIGRVLTSVTDALTRRLIVLNQQILGESPMAFCWLAFGSQGRQDQAGCSDQDNGLLLAAEPDEYAAGYFAALSRGVCAGLDECGYRYCPGDIMAQNPAWRMPLERWQQQFDTWVTTPEPKALMHATIFFDMRSVFGPQSLFDALQDRVLAKTKGNDIFLAGMAATSLKVVPPLGFFRQLVLERDGSEVKGIDLKHRGCALINDIARVYALLAGIKEVNTASRIQALSSLGVLGRKDALDLADAHEFLAHMRLSNQGRQCANGQTINNYLIPEQLSSLMRHQLRDAFKVVHDAQSGLRLKFLRSF